MPYSAPVFLILAFVCIQLTPLWAQKARYSDVYRAYDLTVAGYVKNSIHAWSADAEQKIFQSNEIALTLHVLSPDMQLLRLNTVPLGKVNFWAINFQHTDSCYYANIVLISETRKNLILKVTANGDITDVSAVKGIWEEKNYLANKNRVYSTVQKNNSLFVAVTERSAATDSMDTDEFIHLPGETVKGAEIIEKLIVRKINLATREWIFQVFGSLSKKFHQPIIKVTDSSVLVAAIAEDQLSSKKTSRRSGPSVFLAKLDTSLSDSGSSFILLKNTRGNKGETYSFIDFFHLQNKLLLLSRGLYQKETVYFVPGNLNSTQLQAPRVIRNLVTNSLKITLVDEKNNLLKDTIISKKNESMQWDDFFIISSSTQVDFFCSRKYTANKNGITHISINSHGIIMEEDMIVDVHYEYNIKRAKNAMPGVLLIPFTRKRKTGLMKLAY